MTALAIMGLLPQSSDARGTILLNGTDILQTSEPDLCKMRGNTMGMVFQEPMTALNPVQTIGDQVAETILIHEKTSKADAHKRATAMLERVGLKVPPTRYPHELSGGQRQRVVIAMAIALSPKLLIADEPTTALDVTIQAQILELMKDLREKLGMAVIWITHDLGVVAGIADRVLVMYGGQIVEHAPIAELFGDPQHPYTRALLKTIPTISGQRAARLTVIEGQPPLMMNAPHSCPFRERCDVAFDRCAIENPPRYDVGNGHDAACFYDARTKGPRHA